MTFERRKIYNEEFDEIHGDQNGFDTSSKDTIDCMLAGENVIFEGTEEKVQKTT